MLVRFGTLRPLRRRQRARFTDTPGTGCRYSCATQWLIDIAAVLLTLPPIGCG
jgi:hypothetical protein